MNGRCNNDPLDQADDVCEVCFGEFCANHLIATKSRKHPICQDCAIEVSGVRGGSRLKRRGDPKTAQKRREALKANKKQGNAVFTYFDEIPIEERTPKRQDRTNEPQTVPAIAAASSTSTALDSTPTNATQLDSNPLKATQTASPGSASGLTQFEETEDGNKPLLAPSHRRESDRDPSKPTEDALGNADTTPRSAKEIGTGQTTRTSDTANKISPSSQTSRDLPSKPPSDQSAKSTGQPRKPKLPKVSAAKSTVLDQAVIDKQARAKQLAERMARKENL